MSSSMMQSMIFILSVMTQADQSGAVTTKDAQVYRLAYERTFRTAYRASGIDRCVLAARKTVAAGIDARPICTCAIDKLLETRTVAELKTPP